MWDSGRFHPFIQGISFPFDPGVGFAELWGLSPHFLVLCSHICVFFSPVCHLCSVCACLYV